MYNLVAINLEKLSEAEINKLRKDMNIEFYNLYDAKVKQEAEYFITEYITQDESCEEIVEFIETNNIDINVLIKKMEYYIDKYYEWNTSENFYDNADVLIENLTEIINNLEG